MKNRLEKDVTFCIEVNKLRNWNSELVDEKHPVFREIMDIKNKVFISLDMREYNDYLELKPSDREQYLLNKAI